MSKLKNLIVTKICLFAFAVFPHFLLSQQNFDVSKSSLVIGEILEFDSKILDETRKINIYLPSYYRVDTSKRYPVIYLLDGSLDEDIIHIAGLVQFASFQWIKMIPETIVVGISNVDRKRDFTYLSSNEKDKKNLPTSGQSKDFIAFLEKEVKEIIAQNYRCTNQSTIIGQSLGGLLATEILFNKPKMFNNYIIVSPSLWWDNGSLLNDIPNDFGDVNSIFVGVGKEGEIMERDAMNLYVNILDNKSKKTNAYFKFFEAQDHGDVLHLAVYEAFEKFKEEQKK